MKTNLIKKSLLVLGILAFAIPAVAFAADLDLNATGAGVGGADTTLNASGQGVGGADTGLNASGQNTGGANTGLDVAGQNTGGATTGSAAPADVDSSGNNPVGGSPSNGNLSSLGGSSVSTGGTSVSVPGATAISVPAATVTASCPLLTSYMKLGSTENNGADVAKLQIFLKTDENLDVDVNGTFDQKTEDAVKAFQTKYLSDIMSPWGATQSSGFVYITTQKKINELACNESLTLSPSDQAIIAAYKQKAASAGQNDAVIGAAGPVIPVATANAAATDTVQVGLNSDQNANNSTVAAVGGASVLDNFWNFMTGLFK